MRSPLLGALCALFVPAFFVVACSGGSEGSGSSSGASSSGGGGGSGTGKKGSETAPDTNKTPSTAAPTGKSCASADDCALWYCNCNDGAVVNSRLCHNGSCQGPKAHCESACNAFNHKGWSGSAGGGDDSSASTPKPPKDNGPAGSCQTKNDCSPFECGCTDGSRIAVRDCFGGICSDALSGCQSACSDSGRGDWDGT